MSAGVLLLAAVAALTVLAPGPAQAAPSKKHSMSGLCTAWLQKVQEHNEENKHKNVNKTNSNYEDYKYEMIPDCDEHGNFRPKQCHSFSDGDRWCQPEGGCYHYSDGETWCVCVDVIYGNMDKDTLSQAGEGLHCDQGHRVPITCHEWTEKVHYDNEHGKHEMVPECDEDGNFKPKQCHVFTADNEWCQPTGACFHFREGERWCGCVDHVTGEPDMASITQGGDDLHCEVPVESGICNEWNEKIRHHDEYSKHEVVLDCDEHGNFVPKQCHVFVKDESYCDPHEHCYHFNEGEKWCVCVHPTSGDMDKTSITNGDHLHCDQNGHQIPAPDVAGKPCCPEHWTHFGEHGHEHCFRFIDSKKTWVEAESYCRFEGGRLASIHCKETNRFLQGLSRGDTHDFPLSWVGGHNTVQACFWMWSDGQIFDYENWANEESKNREHSCLRINSGYQLKWSSGCCNETLPFICATEAECGHHW